MPSSKKTVTLRQVAKEAGVSHTTVSFVLNQTPNQHISEATRLRVLDAVKELGYRRNEAARSLTTSRSNIIGFISEDIASGAYAGESLSAAQESAWEQGKLLFIVDTSRKTQLQHAAIDRLLGRHVEGIVYGAMFNREVTLPNELLKLPLVLMDCYSSDKKIPSIVPNDEGGAYQATKHMIERGYKEIIFMQGIPLVTASITRLAGYEKAMNEAGLPVQKVQADWDTGGYHCTHQLLSDNRKPRAIFCSNDRMALGCYDALKERGLSIPNDVAVMGFDNSELSAILHPQLSTVSLPHRAMGAAAVSRLLELIESREPETRELDQQSLSCSLIVRDST